MRRKAVPAPLVAPRYTTMAHSPFAERLAPKSQAKLFHGNHKILWTNPPGATIY